MNNHDKDTDEPDVNDNSYRAYLIYFCVVFLSLTFITGLLVYSLFNALLSRIDWAVYAILSDVLGG